MDMLQKIVPLLMLAGLAQSACQNLTVAFEGHTSAICTDENGSEFEYFDLFDKYPMDPSGDQTSVLNAMYADYLSSTTPTSAKFRRDSTGYDYTGYGSETGAYTGVENSFCKNNAKKLLTRDVQTLHGSTSNCNVKVESVCADDHVINWPNNPGALDNFRDFVFELIRRANGDRMKKDPRVVMVNPDHNPIIYLQWAYNQQGDVDLDQMRAISRRATQCQQCNWSHESKLKNGNKDVPQYFCVSDRNTGCRANGSMNKCNNIPDPPPFCPCSSCC